jgi:hypothetical protein
LTGRTAQHALTQLQRNECDFRLLRVGRMTSFGRSCAPVIIRITGDTPGFRREADNLLETKNWLARSNREQARTARPYREKIGRPRRTRSRMTLSWRRPHHPAKSAFCISPGISMAIVVPSPLITAKMRRRSWHRCYDPTFLQGALRDAPGHCEIVRLQKGIWLHSA